MTWLTHTAFAGMSAWIFGMNVGVAVLGSTAPDWSEDLFGVSEHRGITHYGIFWFLAFLLFLVPTLEGIEWARYPMSFCYGGVTHWFLDSLTRAGVPFTRNMRVRIGGLIRTGHVSEWIFFALIVLFLFPLTRFDLKIGYNKWKEYYTAGIIDHREYLDRRFKLW